MVHFSECSTVAANCDTETQIGMRYRSVEHFPVMVGRTGDGDGSSNGVACGDCVTTLLDTMMSVFVTVCPAMRLVR